MRNDLLLATRYSQLARLPWQTFFVATLLVGFGLGGRWLQPDWNVTPVAAVALFAAYIFRSAAGAALVPLFVVSLSNLILPAYNSLGEMACVYLAFLVPVACGRLLRQRYTPLRFAAFSPLPAVTFYLITNFAVWALNHWYPPTLAGLMECYRQGLPFLQKMLAGDLCYLAAVFGAYVLATTVQNSLPWRALPSGNAFQPAWRRQSTKLAGPCVQ
jgi:hypothetical protein